MALCFIVGIAALVEPQSFVNVGRVLFSCTITIISRATLGAKAYDYLALVGLLLPLLLGIGLTWYGLDLPSLVDMGSYLLYISIAVSAGCIVILSVRMRFTDTISMERHLAILPLVFGFIVVGGAVTDSDQTDSFLTMFGVVTAAVVAPLLCPR